MKSLDNLHPPKRNDFNEIHKSSKFLIEKLGLKKGVSVEFVKRSLFGKDGSALNVGHSLRGKLLADVDLGQPIRLDSGNTSDIKEVYKEGLSFFVKTQTSVYELFLQPNEFEGLSLKNNLGEISFPKDAKISELGSQVVDMPLSDKPNDEKYKVYINNPKLQDILLEVNGGNFFRAMQGRFFIIAKVRNIHLPFYISSAGTSGKNQGEWYPFFGFTGHWLVKGGIQVNGKMEYHPEISKIQEVLNQNLIIPASYLSPQGALGTNIPRGQSEPSKVFFDLKNYFKYQNVSFTNYKDSDLKYVERISGYKPTKVIRHGDSWIEWVSAVVSSIK